MTEPDLAEMLGEHMREDRETEDPRLEALAMGTLAEADRAALMRAAAEDPDLGAQVELFAPLEAGQVARLKHTAAPPKVRPLLRVVPPLLLAAVALLAVLLRGPAPLPTYSSHVEAQDMRLRGAEAPRAGPRRMRADSRLTLALVPDGEVDGEVVAQLYARVGDRTFVAPGVPEVDPSGAARVRGPAHALLGVDSGTVSVALVVARPGALPSAAEALSAAPSVRATVVLTPRR